MTIFTLTLTICRLLVDSVGWPSIDAKAKPRAPRTMRHEEEWHAGTR